MPRLEYFLVAESMSVDQLTNRVSLFNILEIVAVPSFPAVLPAAAVVAVWLAEPGDFERDFQASFTVHSPGLEEPLRFDLNFKLPDARARTAFLIQGLPVQAPGEVRFDVTLNGDHKASHTTTVMVMTPPPPVSNAPPS